MSRHRVGRHDASNPGTTEEDDVGLISGLIKFNLLKRLFRRFSGRRRTY